MAQWPVSAGARGLRSLLRPLHSRNYRLLVLGQTFSTFGDLMFLVAFPYMVLWTGAGVGGLGLTLTLLGVARLVASPIGGLLADRLHPRIAMLITDIGRAAVLGLLTVAYANTQVPLWQLAVAGVMLGGFEGVFLPAYRASVPALLPAKEIQGGNSVGEALNITAAIGGQLMAGLVVAKLGLTWVIGIDSATFALSGLTLLLMNDRGQHDADAKDNDEHEAMPASAATFRDFVRNSRLFQVVVSMSAMVTVTASGLFAVGLPVLAEERFPVGAEMLGYLLAAGAVGRLLGSLVAGALSELHGRGLMSLALLVVHGAVLVGLPAAHGLAVLLPFVALLGLADGTLSVLVMTILQKVAPPGTTGRVMAVFSFVRGGAYPASVAVTGAAIAQLGLTATFIVGGTCVLLVSIIGATQRTVRDA